MFKKYPYRIIVSILFFFFLPSLFLPLTVSSAAISANKTIIGEIIAFHIDPLGVGEARTEYLIRRRDGKTFPLHLSQSSSLFLASGSMVKISNVYQNTDGSFDVARNDQVEVLSSPTATSPEAIGDQPLAVILVDFLDSGPRPFTAAEISSIIFNGQLQNFYHEQSYGQTSWSGQVYDWQQLNRNGVVNNVCRRPGFQNSAELDSLFNTAQVDLARYHRILVLANHPCIQGGLSTIGKSFFTINGQSYQFSFATIGSLDIWNQPSNRGPQPFSWTNLDRLLSHELGHGLGLRHSNGWDCDDQVFIGNCRHVEYGNGFDNMGGLVNGGYTLHFNGYQKELLGWLLPESVLTIATSGRYTITPLETNLNSAGQIKTAKVLLPPDLDGENRFLYLEYRRAIGFDANLNQPELTSNQDGLMASVLSQNSGGWYTRLLDLSPTASDWLPDIKQTTLNTLPSNVISGQIPKVMLGPVINASPNSITFDIGLGDNPCFRLPPDINVLDWSRVVQPGRGGGGVINFTLTNDDYFGCNSSAFQITPHLPTGWTGKVIIANPSLAPRQTINASISFTVPSKAAGGDYPISFQIINLDTGLESIKNLNTGVIIPLFPSPIPARL